MFLIRDVMYCTPGNARAMDVKESQEAMKGYHDLIDRGQREIYQIES